MNPDKPVRLEFYQQIRNRFPQQVSRRPSLEQCVISLGVNRGDLERINQNNSPPGLDGNSWGAWPRRAPMHWKSITHFHGPLSGVLLHGAFQSFVQALGRERFQDVIHGVSLKGREGVLLVCSDKDDGGNRT